MNHPVIVFPLQLASPTMTLRVANATYDLERGGQPKMFFPFFISTPFFNRYEQPFLRIHCERRK